MKKKKVVSAAQKKKIEELRAIARARVEERLVHFNAFYNFSYNDVRIKNVKTRWGSCSTKGNLNFNYKIALLPPHLVDYIIVHELCHLEQMNHSVKFWSLVAKTIPDYRVRRAELRHQAVRLR
jgi:predicted metal-dependent hydrolase